MRTHFAERHRVMLGELCASSLPAAHPGNEGIHCNTRTNVEFGVLTQDRNWYTSCSRAIETEVKTFNGCMRREDRGSLNVSSLGTQGSYRLQTANRPPAASGLPVAGL